MLFAALLIGGNTLSLSAQTQPKDTTLNRTVVVEQEYNPNIMDARKINVLPKVDEITVTPKSVEYDGTIFPATSIPGSPMEAFTGKEVQKEPTKGYARLGYGNRGNLDVRANYLLLSTPQDRLNVSFSVDGMNGKLDLIDEDGKWRSRFYRTKAGAYYLHQFGKIDLNLEGNFGVSNFNYLPASLYANQNHTSGDVRVGLKSKDNAYALHFDIGTGLLLFKKRYGNSDSETIVRTHANVAGDISDEQLVGVSLKMDNIFYDGEKKYDNRTALRATPYYEWNGENTKLHLGANVDFASGSGKSFRASPDVKASYLFSDSYVLYAQATGERFVNDFRRLEEVSPYAVSASWLDDTYEQLNAQIGFKASPVSGLWFNIFGGYQLLKDDLIPRTDFYIGGPARDHNVFYQEKTSNLNVGGKLLYNYKDRFAVSAEGTYYNWDADENINLLLKPEFQFDFRVDTKFLPELNLGLNYQYISRVDAEYNPENAVNNLGVSLTYEFHKGISIYAKGSNLLNKKYSYSVNYVVQGINFVGGLAFRF
ncbi:TonB-dependent receptor [Bacteroides sp. 214]|nr:TonB-dependent receptor [Bacteroides sp. 214]